MSFTNERPKTTEKGVTFKYSHKKTIKIIYLPLILLFYFYFYPPDFLTYWKLSVPLKETVKLLH